MNPEINESNYVTIVEPMVVVELCEGLKTQENISLAKKTKFGTKIKVQQVSWWSQ